MVVPIPQVGSSLSRHLPLAGLAPRDDPRGKTCFHELLERASVHNVPSVPASNTVVTTYY